MTPAQMLPLLQAWKARHAELHKQMQALASLTGNTYDTPFCTAIWETWNAYTATLARLIGDTGEWLAWFEDENDMGAKGLEVCSFTRTIKVRTLRQLATVIAGSRP